MYNGTFLNAAGVIKLHLTYNNVINTFFIIKNGAPSTLNETFMYHFGLDIINFQRIHAVLLNIWYQNITIYFP